MIRFLKLKMPILGLGAAALALTGSLTLAGLASAQDSRYDGYCYVKKTDLAGQSAAVGAAAGALAGVLLGKKGDKTKDAVVGAAVGGTAGYVVGKNSKATVRCSKGRYYVYTSGFYDPSPADRGYKVVFFEERPSNFDLYVVSKGRVRPFHGH